MQEIATGKSYKHYKGTIYKIIALARHSETDEEMVIYQSKSTGDIWARPKAMWNDIVDDKNTLRFSLVD